MTALPEPPVPADADLTHYDNMPLEARRLRDSVIAGIADAEGFRCAVLGWCVAWHQLPAGSLPNDDSELCRLVGLGRDVKTWRKVKDVALRGWRLFADGRLYHPVVTEKVIEAWNSTLLTRWSRECDRIRKDNKGRAERKEELLTTPRRPERIPYVWPTDGERNSDGITQTLPPEPSKLPPEKRLKGREGKGREEKIREDSDSGAPPLGRPPEEQSSSPVAARATERLEAQHARDTSKLIGSLAGKLRAEP